MQNRVKPKNERLDLLIEICKELRAKNIIFKFEECNKHIKAEVNSGGSPSLWNYLAGKFEELGYETQIGTFGNMLIYYEDKKEIIDEVFIKYSE